MSQSSSSHITYLADRLGYITSHPKNNPPSTKEEDPLMEVKVVHEGYSKEDYFDTKESDNMSARTTICICSHWDYFATHIRHDSRQETEDASQGNRVTQLLDYDGLLATLVGNVE
ncbi:hypothetical protein Tco_1088836 [Tanacetum coccineum]